MWYWKGLEDTALLSKEDVQSIVDGDEDIEIKCEFCATKYSVTRKEVKQRLLDLAKWIFSSKSSNITTYTAALQSTIYEYEYTFRTWLEVEVVQ